MEKGEAASDDEEITMDALYRYLSRRARSEGSAATPQRIAQGGVGDLVISANPLMGFSQIDAGIRAALAAEEYRMRMGAVAELTLQMDEIHTVAARAARRLLQRHLDRERDYQVRRAITRALDGSNQPSEAARQTEEERQRAEAARQAEEQRQRAEAVRQAEEEGQRAEAARQAEERRRAEAARQQTEKQQQAEEAQRAEEALRQIDNEREAFEEARTASDACPPGPVTNAAEVAQELSRDEMIDQLSLAGYVVKRVIFSSAFEVRSPDGSRHVSGNESEFLRWWRQVRQAEEARRAKDAIRQVEKEREAIEEPRKAEAARPPGPVPNATEATQELSRDEMIHQLSLVGCTVKRFGFSNAFEIRWPDGSRQVSANESEFLKQGREY